MENHNVIKFKLAYFETLSQFDKERIMFGIETNNELHTNIPNLNREFIDDYKDKYVCFAEKAENDLQCCSNPCIIFVGSHSPTPTLCPYSAQNIYCEWKKVNHI